MITNRDIEIAFVRAQQRINEQIEKAQTEFYLPDVLDMMDAVMTVERKQAGENRNNPLANEEI